MLQMAPYAAQRAVINIIGNGEDNVGEDAQSARDRAVEKGIVVNGVVLGTDSAVMDYYRREIVGGPGAFVMWASTIAAMSDVMARKFQSDIVMDKRRPDAAAELNH